MYYSFTWLALVVASLGVSLLAFIWALRSGQFSEQARLRYLPLRDQPVAAAPGANPARPTAGAYALIAIILAGLLIMLAPVLLSL